MDVGAEHRIRIRQDRRRIVGEEDLSLRPFLLDEAPVVLHVVDAGEGVLGLTEQLDEFRHGQGIGIGIQAGI